MEFKPRIKEVTEIFHATHFNIVCMNMDILLYFLYPIFFWQKYKKIVAVLVHGY